jgi:hypothetical protein
MSNAGERRSSEGGGGNGVDMCPLPYMTGCGGGWFSIPNAGERLSSEGGGDG